MNNNEIQNMFNLTNTKLTEFENANLIKPFYDEFGHRYYNQEDIRLLEIITLLSKNKLAINEIELVLNGQLSLTQLLQSKDRIIDKDIIRKLEKNILRRKAAFEYLFVEEDMLKENYVCFKENELVIKNSYDIKNNTLTVPYKDILELKFSICTRVYSRYIPNQDIIKSEGEYLHTRAGLVTSYNIDMDISTINHQFQLESISIKKMNSIMSLIKEKNIFVIDPLDLVTFFIEHTDKYKFDTQLMNKIRVWTKEFNIDNPRSIDVISQAHQIKNNITSDSFRTTEKIKFTKKGVYIPTKIALPNIVVIIIVIMLILFCIWGYIENY